MKIPAKQLSAHLRSPLLPCYLVTGDEPLLVQEAMDALRHRAREDGAVDRELFVAEARFDWSELCASAGNRSLFAEQRLIELRLPTGKPGRQGGEAIAGLVESSGPDLRLLISAPKLDRGAAASGWVKAVEKRGGIVQVWPLAAAELPAWIAARLRRAGLEADREAVRMLAERVEGNLLAAQQEIDKLRLLLGGGRLTLADVEAAVADSSRYDVYKLVDAAIGGDAARALRILGGLRGEGTEAVIVVWALTRELRILARLAESVAGGTSLGTALAGSGVWRDRQSLLGACVGRHPPAELYRLLQLAQRADASAKGQQAGDPWAIAGELLVGLSQGSARAA
ncbi:MAG: DNA polymerase III subunit delta [Woeseiaceae bacterium]